MPASQPGDGRASRGRKHPVHTANAHAESSKDHNLRHAEHGTFHRPGHREPGHQGGRRRVENDQERAGDGRRHEPDQLAHHEGDHPGAAKAPAGAFPVRSGHGEVILPRVTDATSVHTSRQTSPN